MEEWTLYIIISAVTFVIFAVIGLYWSLMRMRDTLIFRPRRDWLSTPDEPYSDMYVGNVSTRWVSRGHRRVLYFLHGNNGSMEDRGYILKLSKLLGMDLVMIDYRNYGKSRGVPSIENMREDSLDVYDVVRTRYGEENIVVMSESLGSVPAAYIVSKRRPSLTVVLSGISRFGAIAEAHGPKNVFGVVARAAMADLDAVSNRDLFSQANSPVLFVHSKSDELVPYKCALENAAATPPQHNRGLVEIGGGHASPDISREHLADILRVMKLDHIDPTTMDAWRVSMKDMDKLTDFFIIDI